MLLRASSTPAADLTGVTHADIDPPVPDGQWLRALTEATIAADWAALASIRARAEASMGVQAVLDTLIVAAAFNGITRVANATGIPLDAQTEHSTVTLRADTGIDHYHDDEKSTRYR